MSNSSTEIKKFIQAEFNKLVPYKALTGPEIAAIKLAFIRFLEKKRNAQGEIKDFKAWSYRLVVRELLEELSL